VTHGFDSANNHTAYEIFNKTASTVDEWIRQRKHPLRLQKYSTELLPLVTHGFDNANSQWGFRNHQRNCCDGLGMDSTAQTAPPASEIITASAYTGDASIRQRQQPLRPQKSSTKLLPRVTHGFDSANSPCGL
jgi:hypothetical protein